MNPYQRQALFSLIQQMKATLATLETLIVMETPGVEFSAPKSAKMPTPMASAAHELADSEEDELASLLENERASLTLQDQTLKEIWSQAHAASDQES